MARGIIAISLVFICGCDNLNHQNQVVKGCRIACDTTPSNPVTYTPDLRCMERCIEATAPPVVHNTKKRYVDYLILPRNISTGCADLQPELLEHISKEAR